MRILTQLLVLVAAFSFSGAANAQASNPGVTPNEWRLLPRGCLFVEGGPEWLSETGRKMRETDNTWGYMHHYCWAIVQEFRTYRSAFPRNEARLSYAAAIHNLDFVIERSKPGFVYRADMLYRKSRLLVKVGQLQQAADTARLLIAESPTLPEGYIALADVQNRAGQRDDARETLRKGEALADDKARFDSMRAQLGTR